GARVAMSWKARRGVGERDRFVLSVARKPFAHRLGGGKGELRAAGDRDLRRAERLEARLKRHGELEKALERRKRSTCRTRVAAAQRALRGIERRLRVARRRRRQLLDRLELGERGVGRAARRELACEVEARRNA